MGVAGNAANAQQHSGVLDGAIGEQQLRPHCPNLRPQGLPCHGGQPAGVGGFHIVVHQRNQLPSGKRHGLIVEGGIVELPRTPQHTHILLLFQMGEIVERFRFATAVIDHYQLGRRIALAMFRQRRDATAQQITPVPRGNDHTHQGRRIRQGPMNQMAAGSMMGNVNIASVTGVKLLQALGCLAR